MSESPRVGDWNLGQLRALGDESLRQLLTGVDPHQLPCGRPCLNMALGYSAYDSPRFKVNGDCIEVMHDNKMRILDLWALRIAAINSGMSL